MKLRFALGKQTNHAGNRMFRGLALKPAEMLVSNQVR